MIDDDLRAKVAVAIMDAHCHDDWTGDSLAGAALRVVDGAIRATRRAYDPRPWMRHIDRLSVQLERAKAARVLAAVYGSREPTCPKPFGLYRHEDVTGASGTGLVATGVEFDDGTTVLRWRGEAPSTVVWPSLDAAQKIHGHGGRTQVVWLNEDIVELSAAIERDERARVEAELARWTEQNLRLANERDELRAELDALRAKATIGQELTGD